MASEYRGPEPGEPGRYERPRRLDDAGRAAGRGRRQADPGEDDGAPWGGPTRRLPGARGAGRDTDPPRASDRERPGRRNGAVRDRLRPHAALTWPDRVLRGLAGVLAGGLVVLALGLTAVWFGADAYGLPGPGADVVIGHWVGAVLAVAGQRVVDRRPDRTGTLAAAAVVAVTGVVLGVAWFL